MITVAAAVVELLAEAGIRYVFGVPSGPWAPYMEAMRTGAVEFVLVSNEGAAGFMADVCGRLTGRPGACYGTYGPGATNLSTGVGSALLDRSPLLAFTIEASDRMVHRTLQIRTQGGRTGDCRSHGRPLRVRRRYPAAAQVS